MALAMFGKPEIQAAKVADMELDYECILERSRVVSIAPARMPFVGLKGKYNKRWFVDIVNLPHNAMRKQMSDLFSSLAAMSKMALDLTEDDFQLFFRYVTVIVDFFKALLEGEEVALYPHIHADSALRKKGRKNEPGLECLSSDYRIALKKDLFEHLDEALKYRFTHTPSIETLENVQEALDKFSSKALDYFSEKERDLPSLLAKAIRGNKEKTRYESRLLGFLLEKPKGHQLVCILMQTLFSEDVRAEFVERHFATQEQKESLEKALNETENGLLTLPDAFQEAAKKYEKRFSVKAFMDHYGQDREEDVETELRD